MHKYRSQTMQFTYTKRREYSFFEFAKQSLLYITMLTLKIFARVLVYWSTFLKRLKYVERQLPNQSRSLWNSIPKNMEVVTKTQNSNTGQQFNTSARITHYMESVTRFVSVNVFFLSQCIFYPLASLWHSRNKGNNIKITFVTHLHVLFIVIKNLHLTKYLKRIATSRYNKTNSRYLATMFKVHKGVAPVLFNETLPLNEQKECSVSVFLFLQLNQLPYYEPWSKSYRKDMKMWVAKKQTEFLKRIKSQSKLWNLVNCQRMVVTALSDATESTQSYQHIRISLCVHLFA